MTLSQNAVETLQHAAWSVLTESWWNILGNHASQQEHFYYCLSWLPMSLESCAFKQCNAISFPSVRCQSILVVDGCLSPTLIETRLKIIMNHVTIVINQLESHDVSLSQSNILNLIEKKWHSFDKTESHVLFACDNPTEPYNFTVFSNNQQKLFNSVLLPTEI